MFPAGRPGVGLLLLRFAAAAALVSDHPGIVLSLPPGPALAIVLPIGIGLCLGLLTPVLSVAGGLFALIHFGVEASPAVGLSMLLPVVFASASLTLLGPGAYSIDARLFGRRVITVPADGTD
jgi:hypothetical protein